MAISRPIETVELLGVQRALSEARRWAGAAVSFIVALGAWEAVVRVARIPHHLLPPPSLIASDLYDYTRQGVLPYHAYITAWETIAGFLIAAVVGVGLAMLVDRSRWLGALIQPYIVILQATPKVALAPFIIMWFGFGMSSKIVNAALVAVFPIFVSSLAGFASVSVRVIDLMTVLRASDSQVFWKAKLPYALPYIFAGLEIGVLLSLIGAVVGEFVSSTEGLGYLVANWNVQLKTASAFAALTVLVMLGSASYGGVILLKNRVVFWQGKV